MTNKNKDLFDTQAAMYILGYSMNNPRIVSSDKYLVTIDDFTKPLYKWIYGAIFNLGTAGAQKIYPYDIDLNLSQYQEQHRKFSEEGGLQFLENIAELDFNDEAIFAKNYERVKKFTVLRELEKSGIDTTPFYDTSVDPLNRDAEDEKLNRMKIEEILDRVRQRVTSVEKRNLNTMDVFSQNAAKGLRELVAELKENPEVGPPLEGEMINYISRGARFGKSYLISMPSGGGKTRYMVGNMCRQAFPRIEGDKIVFAGDLHKVLYITTEQLPDEIQTLILAYVSGVSEERILYNMLTEDDERKISQALDIIEHYKDNFLLDVIQTPTMTNIRSKILSYVLDKGVDMVCYDYIFIPTDDEGSSFSHQYRADQLLMMISNQLKEIAAVYNIFMLTATQLNGTWEDKPVRNQNMIRDSKAIVDKVDIGMIGVRCTEDEFSNVEPFFTSLSIFEKPNQVIDIYKNRRGAITNAKVFRYFDYGTCRGKDLLVTTQTYKLIDNVGKIEYQEPREYNLTDFIMGGFEE